jgi:tRNA-specific 2-thiouridylase
MLARKAAVAMSGGVDSSVAAALLKNQGCKVFGITMQLEAGEEQVKLAAEIARRLKIPHYVFDLRRPFRQKVIEQFCAEYEQGRTPNPCVECNRSIKFGLLLEKVISLGADYLATGHYARIQPCNDGYRLLKGIDPAKDQSYFLYTLGQKQLQHILMPLGEMYKNQTRRIAREMGMADIVREESQDICFIPPEGIEPYLSRHARSFPGDIVDAGGKVLGRHAGLAHYTIGQRHGMSLPSDKRLYVLRLDAEANRVVVGSLGQLSSDRMTVKNLSWISGKAPSREIEAAVRVRYRAPAAEARLLISGYAAEVIFHEPQRAIAPGQSAVFYSGEEVLGGGIIERAGILQGE